MYCSRSHCTAMAEPEPELMFLHPEPQQTRQNQNKGKTQSNTSVHQLVQLNHKNHPPSHLVSCRQSKWPCDFTLPYAPNQFHHPVSLSASPLSHCPHPGSLPHARPRGTKYWGETQGHDFPEAESQVAKTNFLCLSHFSVFK